MDLLARQVAKISEWLGALVVPGRVVEVRAFGPFASRAFTLGDGGLDALSQYAASLSGRHKGVYWTPNPLKAPPLSGKHGTALDADVLSRHWILIDADPKRDVDTNSTDAEHEQAIVIVRRIAEVLGYRGFGGMVLGDSGNGGHLMVPVELDNDDASREMHRTFLKHLQQRFGTRTVDVDVKTFNAARIWKMPATLAMKGPNTAERPHRYARLLDVPESPWRYCRGNNAGLEKVLTEWGYKSNPGTPTDDRASLIRRAQAYVAKEPPAVSGQDGSGRCYHVACCLVVGFDLKQDEAFEAIQAWNATCQPPWSEKELRHKLADANKQTGPRGELAAGRAYTGPAGKSKTADELPADELIVWANTIEPRKVEWLWPWRIPLGMLTTFAGQTDVGKTFSLLDISARVTVGGEWPYCAGECAPPGKVLFISGEDEPDVTLVPRLIEMGADLSKVAFLKSAIADQFTLADIPLLERVLTAMSGDVRLVAIDPPTAFLGEVDDHKNAQLRRVLSPLKSFASRWGAAIVFITHFNKAAGGKIDALSRVMGSVAWVATVRAAHMFAHDPDDDDKRVFLPLKMNIGPKPKGLSYQLGKTTELARVEWLGEIDVTADEAANKFERQPPRRKLASEWLISLFREKLEWRSTEFWASAREHGVSKNAINEARNMLGMPRTRKVVGAMGDVDYIWWVPADWPHLTNQESRSTEAI